MDHIDPVKAYLAEIGSKGGRAASGERKRRTPDQARKAGLASAAARAKSGNTGAAKTSIPK